MAQASQEQNALRDMIASFRVSELQLLLGFAGRNKYGKKEELLARSLELVKIRSTPLQSKIKELYKSSQAAEVTEMMGPNGQPLNYGMAYNNLQQLMGMGGAAYANIQQQSLQGRNPYQAGYPPNSQAMAGHPGYPGMVNSGYPQVAPSRTIPLHPNVKLQRLPFYDIHAELLKPATLIAQGGNRFQEAQFTFVLSPTQATNIASNRDIQIGARLDFLYQIQLRFFPLTAETSNVEISDEFPPSVVVHVNGKQVPLPNPIPTNKPGVEPKRPPKPVNITPHCKLSPILPNAINIKWASEYNKTWVVGIWLVMKLTSDDLLDRLKKKGTRDPAYTKALIIEKLNDNDADVATTSLKVTVSCPLGKMRMRVPCRPQTCSHLQCFDAATFLQMNERKPTWNCPVCDSKANYSDLLIDGYFQETLESKDLPEDENDIILEADGSWKPVPKDEEAAGAEAAAAAAKKKAEEKDVDCIDLSDDEEGGAPPPPRPPHNMDGGNPPLPPQPPPPVIQNIPMPPAEIECIDLD